MFLSPFPLASANLSTCGNRDSARTSTKDVDRSSYQPLALQKQQCSIAIGRMERHQTSQRRIADEADC